MQGTNFFIKLDIIIRTILEIDNWHVPILHYFDMRDNEDIVRFRDGTRCIIRNKSDTIAFFENFFLNTNTSPKNFAIKKNDVIIDIGAHIGFFTIYAAKHASKGFVYSFEPSSKSFNLLQKNIKLNKLDNVIIENVGVLKKSGSATLYVDEENSIGNSIFGNKANKKEIVTTVSLHDIFKKFQIERVDLLKMDCEGAEYEIILSLSQDILKKIVRISSEIHKVENYKVEDLSKYLTENNFEVEYRYLISDSVNNMPMLYATNKILSHQISY